MTTVEPASAGLIERVKNLLIQPRAEWERIATERTGLGALLTGYVLPLAGIAALCSFIGMSVIGTGALGFSYRVPLVPGLVGAVTQVVMTLVWVWVLGLIINTLASTFASQADQTQANQLAAYTGTAGYIGAFFTIIPALGIVALVGAIYSLVLLYLGIPRLMKTPEDKRLPYFVTIIVAAIVVGAVAALALGAVRTATLGLGGAGLGVPGVFGQARQAPEGEVRLPGGGSVELSELERAAKQLEAMAENPQAAQAAAAVSMDQLRVLLPETLPGGFARTELSTGSTGMMGGVANASGVYEREGARIELTVTDLGAAGAFAAMAGAFGAQGSRENADGYERVATVDGRMTMEEVNRPGQTAKYGVVAGQRILIQADGQGVGVEDVRAAVNAVGVGRAEALAQQQNAATP